MSQLVLIIRYDIIKKIWDITVHKMYKYMAIIKGEFGRWDFVGRKWHVVSRKFDFPMEVTS